MQHRRVTTPDEINTLLRAAGEGDREALDRVFTIVYEELRGLAHVQRNRWHGDYTLDTTALVHEAYLKLVDANADWNDRGHFMAVAAKAMRQILVNYAERRLAMKRGGGAEHTSLDDSNPMSEETADEVLALNEALNTLSEVSERQAHVVEARFFGGLTIEDTAAALKMSPATAKRDWTLAKAWLHREIRLHLAG
jgi:RNA polymerase sigma factor (TIGR02999 family)